MDLRQLINANLAALCILAAFLAGSGQGNWLLAGATVLAAASSWRWCDTQGRIAVGRWFVNAAVLAIAAVAAARLLTVGGASDAAVAADGLAVLSMVLMFERKTPRTWWDLFSSSLLQVFLSCALNHGPLFAVITAGYFFFALSALALLALHREQQRVAASAARCGSAGSPAVKRRIDGWRLAGVAAATLIVGPLSLYLRFGPASEESGEAAELAGREASSAGGLTNGHARRYPRPAGRRRRPGPGREFWWRIARMTLVSGVIGAIVFCLTPRFGGVDFSWLSGRGGPWRDTSAALRRTVGFSDQVRLGELGSVLEDIQRVMTIRLVRPEDNERYLAEGHLFLRGAILNQYQNGQWEYRGDGESVSAGRLPERPDGPSPGVVRQEIRLDPMDHQELFCVWPFLYLADDDRLQFNPGPPAAAAAGYFAAAPVLVRTGDDGDGRRPPAGHRAGGRPDRSPDAASVAAGGPAAHGGSGAAVGPGVGGSPAGLAGPRGPWSDSCAARHDFAIAWETSSAIPAWIRSRISSPTTPVGIANILPRPWP